MKNKTILITGATGFVGSHLAREFLHDGHDIHILVRSTSNFWRIEDIRKDLRLHVSDILDKKQLQKIMKKVKPEYIMHLANVGLYGGKEDQYEQVINVNFTGTVNLLHAAESIDYACFINTGSSSEYGPKTKKMKEDDVCFPKSTYAVTKLASTVYSKSYGEKNKRNVINLRLFSPFGEYDNYSRLVNSAISLAVANKPINLAYKKSVRDYIYIKDVVAAYVACMKNYRKAIGEIINIGTGKETSVYDMINYIIDASKSKSTLQWNTPVQPRFESKVWEADKRKAKDLLEWETAYSVKEGVKRTVKWIQEAPELDEAYLKKIADL